MRRTILPILAFLGGVALMAGIYLGLLAWLEGWKYAIFQLGRDRGYVIPILLAFGLQSALYAILRLGLYAPAVRAKAGGAVMGASGGTSATSMIACCLHHTVNVLPILGLSAATAFLARYQREFLQLSLVMNIAGILIMLAALQNARQRLALLTEAA